MNRTFESFQMLTTQDALEYPERGESWFYLQFFNSTIFRARDSWCLSHILVMSRQLALMWDTLQCVAVR